MNWNGCNHENKAERCHYFNVRARQCGKTNKKQQQQKNKNWDINNTNNKIPPKNLEKKTQQKQMVLCETYVPSNIYFCHQSKFISVTANCVARKHHHTGMCDHLTNLSQFLVPVFYFYYIWYTFTLCPHLFRLHQNNVQYNQLCVYIISYKCTHTIR